MAAPEAGINVPTVNCASVGLKKKLFFFFCCCVDVRNSSSPEMKVHPHSNKDHFEENDVF